MNLSLKFHKDPSFRCGDICKTIMTLSSRVKITRCFGYFSKDFLSKMFLLISKKRPLETFQILLRWFGTHSKIVRMSSDPLTHSKKPILCSGSVWIGDIMCLHWGCKYHIFIPRLGAITSLHWGRNNTNIYPG